MGKEGGSYNAGLDSLIGATKRAGENREFVQTGFVPTDDMMDRLRIDTSCLPPSGERLIPELAIEIIDVIESTYGSYIPEETLETSVGIIDRLLCMDDETYDAFYAAWNTSSFVTEEDAKKSMGVFFTEKGRVIPFRAPPKSLFEEKGMYTDEEQALLDSHGGLDHARKQIISMHFINVLSHEIVHEYAASVQPKAVAESGADYYATHVSRELGFPYGLLMGYGEKPRAFYTALVQKYGADIHRYYFDPELDESVRNTIDQEFTPEVERELFGDPNEE